MHCSAIVGIKGSAEHTDRRSTAERSPPCALTAIAIGINPPHDVNVIIEVPSAANRSSMKRVYVSQNGDMPEQSGTVAKLRSGVRRAGARVVWIPRCFGTPTTIPENAFWFPTTEVDSTNVRWMQSLSVFSSHTRRRENEPDRCCRRGGPRRDVRRSVKAVRTTTLQQVERRIWSIRRE